VKKGEQARNGKVRARGDRVKGISVLWRVKEEENVLIVYSEEKEVEGGVGSCVDKGERRAKQSQKPSHRGAQKRQGKAPGNVSKRRPRSISSNSKWLSRVVEGGSVRNALESKTAGQHQWYRQLQEGGSDHEQSKLGRGHQKRAGKGESPDSGEKLRERQRGEPVHEARKSPSPTLNEEEVRYGEKKVKTTYHRNT